MVPHIVDICFMYRCLVREYLWAFAHKKDWEVVWLLIMLPHIVHHILERLLVILVNDWFLTISRHVQSIDLIKNRLNILWAIQIRYRNDSHPWLLQKLNMCFWNIRNLLICRVNDILLRPLRCHLYILNIIEITAGVQIITNTVQNIGFHGLWEHCIHRSFPILNPDIFESFERFIIPTPPYSFSGFVIDEMHLPILLLLLLFLLTLLDFLFLVISENFFDYLCIRHLFHTIILFVNSYITHIRSLISWFIGNSLILLLIYTCLVFGDLGGIPRHILLIILFIEVLDNHGILLQLKQVVTILISMVFDHLSPGLPPTNLLSAHFQEWERSKCYRCE